MLVVWQAAPFCCTVIQMDERNGFMMKRVLCEGHRY